MVGSALIIFNCLFKFGYWRLWMGVLLKDIPLSGRPEERYVNHSSFKARIDAYWSGGVGSDEEKLAEHHPSSSTAATAIEPITTATAAYDNDEGMMEKHALEMAYVKTMASTPQPQPASMHVSSSSLTIVSPDLQGAWDLLHDPNNMLNEQSLSQFLDNTGALQATHLADLESSDWEQMQPWLKKLAVMCS